MAKTAEQGISHRPFDVALPRYDLVKDKKDDWALKRGERVVKRFDTKEDATAAIVIPGHLELVLLTGEATERRVFH